MEFEPKQKEAIAEVLSTVIAQVRPEESILVPYAFEQQTTVKRRTDGLGFGADTQLILWMYPIFHVILGLTGKAAEEFAKKWGEHLAEWVWSKTPGAKLDASALESLRKAVVEKLGQAGVANADSERAGDSMVSVLIGKPELLRQIVKG